MKLINNPLAVWLLAAFVLAPAVVCAGEGPAPAAPAPQVDQPQPASVRRPYRGIFGGPADPNSKQALTLTGSIFGAYDDDVFAADSGSNVPLGGSSNSSGYYGGLSAGADYSRNTDRVSFGLLGNVGVNRYVAQHQTAPIYSTAANISAKVARRTTVSAGAGLVYAPEYRLGLFISPTSLTGALDPFNTVAPDYDLFSLEAYRTSASVTLSQALGQRSALEGWYSLMNVNYVHEAFDYRSQAGGGRFTHRLTRNLGVRLGYSYGEANYNNQQAVRPQRIHNIEAGVDYSRALSFSRRTTFSFSTGSAVLVRDKALGGFDGNRSSFQVIGNASLTHEIGRTWTAQLAYRRAVDFREGFYDPFLTDGASASLGGLLSRRVRFSSSIDYALGSVGVTRSNNFHSASANAGLEVGLTRNLAFYGRYVYYAYDFDAEVALDSRFPRKLDRQGVRIGLTAFVPVLR